MKGPREIHALLGANGSGKTTLARAVAQHLGATLLREPCDRLYTPGKFVRDRLAAPPPHWTPEAWACAMIAGMLEQDMIARSVLSDYSLGHARDVVYDRRELSTLVYQSDAIQQIPDSETLSDVEKDDRACALANFVTDAAKSLAPADLTIILTAPTEVLLERTRAKRGADNAAHEDPATLDRIRRAYEDAGEVDDQPRVCLLDTGAMTKAQARAWALSMIEATRKEKRP